ncbi:hypothetical protein, partial [Mesorhizobium sp.]|uniref:hypothetical protein n=1 Tax=Mesorhizobium sp. TaxID=1871066 RepID=UPI00257CE19E
PETTFAHMAAGRKAAARHAGQRTPMNEGRKGAEGCQSALRSQGGIADIRLDEAAARISPKSDELDEKAPKKDRERGRRHSFNERC